jgi:hypothetical protein
MSQLHIPHIRLNQLKPEPPKQHTQRQIKFRPRQIHAKAIPRAASETHHEALERFAGRRSGVVEPALGDEGFVVGENCWVVAEIRDGHADACICGDEPIFVYERGAARARITCRETITQTHGFHDAAL